MSLSPFRSIASRLSEITCPGYHSLVIYLYVFAADPLLRRASGASRSPALATGSPIFIYPLFFLHLAHSLAQWALHNSFVFKRFRTLSIATGVWGVVLVSLTKSFSAWPPRGALRFHRGHSPPCGNIFTRFVVSSLPVTAQRSTFQNSLTEEV